MLVIAVADVLPDSDAVVSDPPALGRQGVAGGVPAEVFWENIEAASVGW